MAVPQKQDLEHSHKQVSFLQYCLWKLLPQITILSGRLIISLNSECTVSPSVLTIQHCCVITIAIWAMLQARFHLSFSGKEQVVLVCCERYWAPTSFEGKTVVSTIFNSVSILQENDNRKKVQLLHKGQYHIPHRNDFIRVVFSKQLKSCRW